MGTNAETAEQRQRLREALGPVGVWLSALGGETADVERAAAAEIERLGYGSLWIGEAQGKEAFVHSGILLAASQRLIVGTGIANIWARDATATNAAAQTLGEAYPGRFVLGLGVSHAVLVDSRGHDYGKPLSAMRAHLDGIDGADYGSPPPTVPVPVVLAALRPRMLALSGERTAGAHSYFVPPEHTRRSREALGPEPLLIPEQAIVLETDAVVARATARHHMKLYLQLPNYRNSLLELGWSEADLDDGGSDALVDAIVAWGDEQAIVTRVREHLAAGADHVLVQPVVDPIETALESLRRLAGPLLEG